MDEVTASWTNSNETEGRSEKAQHMITEKEYSDGQRRLYKK